MDYSDEWNPIFKDDFTLNFETDPINFIRYNVFKRNEAWDNRILGFRGGGKSTVGLSALLLYNPKLINKNPSTVLKKCWCFTTEDRNKKKDKLRRGDVLVTDEQGTRISGSSYKYLNAENQMLADSKQLDRVDGVLEIGITLDEMRVIKRVRNIYRVDIFPETKLSNEENKNNGMGIDCIIRELKENPFSNHDNDRFIPKYFNYSDAGRISRITLPLPPVDLWNEYMILRKEFKEILDSEEMSGPQLETETYTQKIKRLIKENQSS